MNKIVIFLMGPSGSGKSTLEHALTSERTTLSNLTKKVVSSTTRPMRDGEVDGETYHFRTDEEFEAAEIIQRTHYSGHKYSSELGEFTTRHPFVVFTVTPNSALDTVNALRKHQPNTNFTFLYVYFDISYDKRIENMMTRGDDESFIRSRVAQDGLEDEFRASGIEADYVVLDHMLNDDLKKDFTEWLIHKTTEYIEPTDYLGDPIYEGDFIAYPVRQGSAMYMKTALVEKLTYEREGYSYPVRMTTVLKARTTGERWDSKNGFVKSAIATKIYVWNRAITVPKDKVMVKWPELYEEARRLFSFI